MQNKKAEIEFFDRFGDKLGYDAFTQDGYDRILAEFNKFLPKRKNVKVIDVGCGTGAFTAQLQKYNYDLTGLDISPRCILLAKKETPKIGFQIGDIEHMKFKSETFDVVVMSGVLHHFPELSTPLKECFRILKKGGILLAYDCNKNNPFMWLYRAKESPMYTRKGITENERLLDKRTVEKALQKTGFAQVTVNSISGVTYKYLDNKYSSIILPIYNVIEEVLDIEPLRSRFGSFLISFAKK